MNDIDKKLNRLSTFYFVLAALCIPVSFVAPVIMIRAASGVEPQGKAIMLLAAGGGLFGSLLLTGCIALVGHAIRKRRWWNFCYVVSILMCPSFPLGTALGIFSLIVLNKPEAKEMFAPNKPPECYNLPRDGAS